MTQHCPPAQRQWRGRPQTPSPTTCATGARGERRTGGRVSRGSGRGLEAAAMAPATPLVTSLERRARVLVGAGSLELPSNRETADTGATPEARRALALGLTPAMLTGEMEGKCVTCGRPGQAAGD